MFMVFTSISRGIISMNGPGGRPGASSVCAAVNSWFSVHTAYRWERKKPPHSATAACRNRKGQVTAFQVLHSSPAPKYLQWNLGALRRRQRLKFSSSIVTRHKGVMLRVPARRCRHLHPQSSSLQHSQPPRISCGILWGHCCALWAGSGEQQSPGQKWPGKQLGPVQGGATAPVLLLAAPPARGIWRSGASTGRAGSAGAAAARGLGCERACQGKGKAAHALKLFFPFLSK